MSKKEANAQETIEDEARRWIVRMASGEMTPQELTRFRAWRQSATAHNHAFERQRGLWRAIGARPAAAHRLPPPRPARLRLRRWLSRPAHGVPRKVVVPAVAAAMAAILLLGPDLALTLRSDYRTGTDVQSLALQDGSRVMLNAGSAIAVRYGAEERRIDLLRGDAWFEVAHGDKRPFRVATLGGVTQDIGTAFEVERADDHVLVSVTQGAVKVGTASRPADVILKASGRAVYDKEGRLDVVAALDPTDMAPWRQGEILLNQANAADAVAAVARYRTAPVYMLGTPDAARRVSGVFRISQTDEAIDAIAHIADLGVYRVGGMIVLRPKR